MRFSWTNTKGKNHSLSKLSCDDQHLFEFAVFVSLLFFNLKKICAGRENPMEFALVKSWVFEILLDDISNNYSKALLSSSIPAWMTLTHF